MDLTKEQQNIQDTILLPTTTFVAASAVSGAGKTSLLTSIADAALPKSALYLAYNKAIATEASRKFSKAVTCSTTHSLAYTNTVRPCKLSVGFFGFRDVKEKMSYEDKCAVVDTLRDFCLSEYTSVDKYSSAISTSPRISALVTKYLGLMQDGLVDATHDFYLKLYHIFLATKEIVPDQYDLIMLDEAGDLNPVTLEIFKLLPAKKKIMVGDENQNIYSFNGTINGFKAMSGTGIHMHMTQSFRVSAPIAKRVEAFCVNHLNPAMSFKGVDYTDNTIKTTAFISRTNSTLIGEMIKLNMLNKPYNLTRPAKQIFQLPLIIVGLKPGGYVANPQYKFLQELVDDYARDSRLRTSYRTVFSYIGTVASDDVNLKSAIGLVAKHSAATIVETYKQAASHETSKHSHTLCTAHSSKGLEFDSVTVADDANLVIAELKDLDPDALTPEEQEEFRLHYVLVTRCKKQLLNAVHL